MIIGVILLAAGVVVVILVVVNKHSKGPRALSIRDAEEQEAQPDYSDRPKPKAPLIEMAKEQPKPTDPDYVKIKLVEHGSLESLIKKGPEDAFNKSSEAYKTDESLEKLIKKGPEDAFNTNANDYKSDESLEKLIRKGKEDPFAVGTEESSTSDDVSGIKADDDTFGDGIKSDDDTFGSGFEGEGNINSDNDAFGSGFADDN